VLLQQFKLIILVNVKCYIKIINIINCTLKYYFAREFRIIIRFWNCHFSTKNFNWIKIREANVYNRCK